MTDWTEVRLEELASRATNAMTTGPFGSAIGAKHFIESGVPVIRGSNLSLDVGVRLREEGLAFLAPSKAKEFRRSIAKPGDLVFTCWGTVGQVGLIDGGSRFNEYVVSNKQMKLTPDPELVDSRFLYYLLSGHAMTRIVQDQAIGVAVPGFNLGQLRRLRVLIPPLQVQRAISSVLAALDDLIENNRRRVDLLEQMAEAIYREWFVHFRYPGYEGVAMVDSPLGPIPEGWQVLPASAALTINPGHRFDKTECRPFVSMRDLSEDSMLCFSSESRAGYSGAKFQNGDTLFARITPCLENGKTGFVQFLPDGIVGRGSTELIVLRGREVGPAFTYQLARLSDFRANAIQSMSGASGRQRVRIECFDSYLVATPPPTQVQEFEATAKPLYDLIFQLASENRVVTKLRDVLLPKLVTGQIDVSELDLGPLVEAAG